MEKRFKLLLFFLLVVSLCLCFTSCLSFTVEWGETPGEGTPGEGTPGEGTPGEGTPGEGTPGEGTPGEGTPGEGTPGEGTPGEGTPGEGTPGEGTPGEGTPGEGTPGEGTPGEGTPGEGTPGEGTPGEGTPGEGTPGEGTPGEGTPSEGTPGEGTPEDDEPETPANPTVKTYTVTLFTDEGAVVDGDNSVTVEDGGSATFSVILKEGFVFSSVSAGSFDQSTGILTVADVKKNIRIQLLTEAYEAPVEKFQYYFRGTSYDTSDALSASVLTAGTLVSLNATDTTRVFVGWTVGSERGAGGTLLSEDRVCSFRIDGSLADSDGRITVFPNYRDADRIYYSPNGGTVNSATANMSGNNYYSVSEEDGLVRIDYSAAYLGFMEAASSFWDDGSFARAGYVLKEYNTRADGSGESFSLGSKVPLVLSDGSTPVLYCIWAEETNPADFEYEECFIKRPVSESAAPNWRENGIKITFYFGNDSKVVIPEEIDGKPVIAIGDGALWGLDMTELVISRHVVKIEDGAVRNCPSLETVYFPDGMYSISDDALDAISYTSLRNFYVNATLAPRFVGADNGGLSVKLSRLMAYDPRPRVVVIGGSSSYQGLGTEYLEALLDGEYRVVNFGTTRTTHGMLYLEAASYYTDSNDLIIYAPENSSYMLGEGELYWKTLRDLESMNNIFRHVDISSYTGILDAFADFNKNYRYTSNYPPRAYEEICVNGSLAEGAPYNKGTTNRYGDYLYIKRQSLSDNYIDSYFITLNEYVKSKDEGWWNNVEDQTANKDYTDPDNITWANITDPYFKDRMNKAIEAAGSSGAKVMFGFCPVDSDALVDGAEDEAWQMAYDELILSTYVFDGIVGSSSSYVWTHEYFYDCAFHLNDMGRTSRTYRLYRDLVSVLDVKKIKAYDAVGTEFEGCLFDMQSGSLDVSFSGEDANAAYFVYDYMENGALTIVGLTEEGKTMTSLTVPLGAKGVKVMGISEGAFRGSSLESLKISADSNLSIIFNGAFDGASSLRHLWIYKTTGDDIAPPASFSGVASGFLVHVPPGSDYAIHYYWSERGLSFVYDAI